MGSDETASIDDVARLLAVLVRDSFETQADAIVAMSDAGMASARIADLLGTSPGTVRDAVRRAKKRK